MNSEVGETLAGLPAWCALLAAVSLFLRLPLLTEPRRPRKNMRSLPTHVRLGSLLAGIAGAGLAVMYRLPVEVTWLVQVLAAAAVLYGAGGVRWLRVVVPGLMLLAVPATLGLTERALAAGLQELAAEFSAAFYGSFLSGQYERDGFSLRLLSAEFRYPSSPTVVVTVAPECGGYRSLCGMSIAALLFVSHPALPLRRKLLLLLTAVVIALGLNLSRLAMTLSLYHWGHARLARGTAHALLSQGVLAAGVGCLYVAFRTLLRSGPKRGATGTQEVTAC
jgi:exosortase/archaeosortase family protein